jgi:hypothetical protein
MAFARQTDLTLIRPLGSGENKAKIRKGTLGATTEAGEVVALQSDGKWDPADASAVVLTAAIAVQGGADGDVVDLVVWGPVASITGATPGALVYVSDTAGEMAETAGTKSTIVGYVETATILFVQPQVVSLS